MYKRQVKPGAKVAVETTVNKRIGLIGTEANIRSGVYTGYIKSLDGEAKVFEKACPLFVPLVEEGWLHDDITLQVASRYLEELKEKDRYQTVYAKYEGSAAAPTAGLHFTNELLEKIEQKGIDIANVTLHVGIGTFRPVKEDTVEAHEMHSEHFYIKQEDCDKINKAKKNGKRVIAVGTTSCRVLETIANPENGTVEPIEGDTQIFIYPGYTFKCIDGLITNFHLPQSTLLLSLIHI